MNYYGRFNIRAFGGKQPCAEGDPTADNGWCIHPAGLETMLAQTAARFAQPLIVGENGLADATYRDEILRRSR